MNQQNLITTTGAIDPVFMFIFGDGNIWLEIVWIVLPTLLVLAMFWYGWKEYLVLRTVPKGALQVTATARMWSWNFSYAGGRTSPRLYVPVGRPVRVELVSEDVIHGFFLPAFRVKRDVVPGMPNFAWFVASKPGSYDLFCSQYCGTGHSAMITTVEALPEAEFALWLNQKKGDKEQSGHELLERHGCLGCHSEDGTPGVGPTFRGIWGRSVSVVTNGTERTIVVDEAYLRRSILVPGADVVKGFQPIMPPFSLKDEELATLLKYLKVLK